MTVAVLVEVVHQLKKQKENVNLKFYSPPSQKIISNSINLIKEGNLKHGLGNVD